MDHLDRLKARIRHPLEQALAGAEDSRLSQG
jgi:hypothetical protein